MKKKSSWQTAPKLSWKNAILLAATGLALCTSSAFAASTTWVDGKSSWFIAGNWDSGEPDCSTDAEINNNGTAQINAPTPLAQCHDLTLGAELDDSGNVSVSNGNLSICENAFIGAHETGTLSITNAGSVTTAGYAAIAAFMGTGEIISNGSATVDGAGSTWTVTGELDVGGSPSGQGGTGLLTVINGGIMSAGTSVHVYSSGTLTGSGTVNVDSGAGTATFDGTLTPKGGGTTLSFEGDLQLDSGATTQCNVTPLDPSTTPQVSVSEQVSLGGRLSVTMTGDFSSAPTRFTLLYAESVNSSHPKFDFMSITYPTNQCWYPVINYVTDVNGHYYVYLDRVDNCN
jgi:T5SS/PEP-CTERM-associated repeat protein